MIVNITKKLNQYINKIVKKGLLFLVAIKAFNLEKRGKTNIGLILKNAYRADM